MDSIENLSASVLIENFPLDINEEKIVNLCRQAGNVIRFRMLYDELKRFNGKIICEFSDHSIAINAKKNLNHMKVGSNILKVDMLSKKTSSIPLPPTSPKDNNKFKYSNISDAVASLPPEQMYELMKQMKFCIQTNPNEARNMLLRNHQLAYALLQAQIVMKIVDPKVAIAMLNRSSDQIPEANIQNESSNYPSISHFSSNNDKDIRNPSYSNAPEIPLPLPQIPKPAKRKFTTYPSDLPLPTSCVDHIPMSPPKRNTFNIQEPQKNRYEFKSQYNMSPMSRSELIVKKPFQSEPYLNDKDKAALIEQVLKLTDEEIALLPIDQRNTILVLKEQYGNSSRS